MKDGIAPAYKKQPRPKDLGSFIRSAVLTFLLLAGGTVITMVFLSPRQLALLPGLLCTLVASVTAFPAHAHNGSHHSPPYEANANHTSYGQLGAIASESSICSNIGRDLLLQGGNAADALVGTTFCVGVIGMYHSGIGGGGFMLVRGADGEYEYIDFRETAPAAAFQDMYINNTQGSTRGGLAR